MPNTNGLKLGRAARVAMAQFVRDVESLRGCLQRARAGCGPVVFWNATRDFRIVLRLTDDEDEDDEEDGLGADWELCVWPPDEDDDGSDDEGRPARRLADVLDMEYGGFWDGDLYVVRAFDADDPDLEGMREAINAAYGSVVCPCGAHLIKDGGGMCLACHLSHDPAKDARHFCAICQEHGSQRHMVRQACCGQLLHRVCLAGSRDPRCPLCREVAARPGAK